MKAVQKIDVVRVDEPIKLISNDWRKDLHFINPKIRPNGEFEKLSYVVLVQVANNATANVLRLKRGKGFRDAV